MTNEIMRYLGIAFASSVLLLVLSKIIMQAILRRPADYYLKEEYKQEEIILNSAGFSITAEMETTPEGEVTEEHIHVEPQIPKPEPEVTKAEKPAEKPAAEKIPAGVPLTKSGKPRKPSMSMKKDELIAIAEWKGIELPPEATKAVILGLIESENDRHKQRHVDEHAASGDHHDSLRSDHDAAAETLQEASVCYRACKRLHGFPSDGA